MKNFYAKLTGKGRVGSEAFISQLSDTAISNETDRVKANAQARFQSSSFYTQAMSSITGLASTIITTAVSAASLVGISATLLVIIVAAIAPTPPPVEAPQVEVPVLTIQVPVALPIPVPTQPPIIAPDIAAVPPPPTPQEATKNIMQMILQALATDPGLQAQMESAPTPEPLLFTNTIASTPADGSVATDFSNFISTYTCN